MGINHPTLVVTVWRSDGDLNLANYEFRAVWYTGKYTDRPGGRKRHERRIDGGSFVYPHPVHDVRLVLEVVTARVRRSAAADAALRTPGRERSGLENVLPQPGPPLELPPQSAATTSDESAVNPPV